MSEIWNRIKAMFSRKFILALVAVVLVMFKLDTDPEIAAAVSGAIAAVYFLANVLQKQYQK